MKRRSSCSLLFLLGVCSLLAVNCSDDEPPRESPLILETVQIPGGTFIMGSPATEVGRQDDEGQHKITLTSFRMTKYEITNSEFALFLNDKKVDRYGYYPEGSELEEKLVNLNTSSGVWVSDNEWIPVTGYENHPAVDVTWFGAAEFAAWVGGRLPTEAEWEYACRGNTNSEFNTGTCLTNEQGNYDWNSPYNLCSNTASTSVHSTQAVGMYPANAFGLHDMHGNVWEWCSDEYGFNPGLRVLRGGSWFEEAASCRAANRHAVNSVIWNVSGENVSSAGCRVMFKE